MGVGGLGAAKSSIVGDFFEAAVFGFNTKNEYQNDLDG